jgi:predicted enzyme related to lactoylglutathione lyase
MGHTSNTSNRKKKANAYASWFEIPVHNIQRAVAFYGQIFNVSFDVIDLSGYSMAIFPAHTEIGGALVMGPGSIPSEVGVLVYLNAGDDLNAVLSKVERAGGRVIMEKTEISKEAGCFALFIDSEGNKLALHSSN